MAVSAAVIAISCTRPKHRMRFSLHVGAFAVPGDGRGRWVNQRMAPNNRE